MASARRRIELQALVFAPQYIWFKPKGTGVTLYFSSCERIEGLIKSMTHGTLQRPRLVLLTAQ